MNSIQENRMSMYLTVQKVTNYHKEKWEAHPAFATIFGNFEEQIAIIRETRSVQEGQITGVTKDKAEAQNNAVEKGLQVSTAVFAFASVIGNNKLQDRVGYSPTELRRCRDTILIDRLTVIIEAANQNITELENYGLKQADIDEFQAIIDKYAEKVEDPRQAITNRSRATKELADNFKNIDKVLKEQLDKLMLQFKTEAKIFFQQYQNARLIINLGHRFTKVAEGSEGIGEETPEEIMND